MKDFYFLYKISPNENRLCRISKDNIDSCWQAGCSTVCTVEYFIISHNKFIISDCYTICLDTDLRRIIQIMKTRTKWVHKFDPTRMRPLDLLNKIDKNYAERR